MPMITSPDNQKLKEIRKLARSRKRTDLFIAEGEDLVDAAWEASTSCGQVLMWTRGSWPTPRRWLGNARDRRLQRALVGAGRQAFVCGSTASRDPGNIGTIIRSAHALCDGPVIIGPAADPYGAKRAREHGLDLRRPPARAVR
jgi:tRNA G18 (ribose-2'-O)-methylase SpoU